MTLETKLTLAVVGMPSVLALCSASFLAILSLSSSVLSGILDLEGMRRMEYSLATRRGCRSFHLNLILLVTLVAFSSSSPQPFLFELKSDSQPLPGCQRQWPRRHWGGYLMFELRKTEKPCHNNCWMDCHAILYSCDDVIWWSPDFYLATLLFTCWHWHLMKSTASQTLHLVHF